jgi:FixJ family two-component response regulator
LKADALTRPRHGAARTDPIRRSSIEKPCHSDKPPDRSAAAGADKDLRAPLTDRERQVFVEVAAGLTNRHLDPLAGLLLPQG